MSTTHIEFDSRNDESEVVFEVEALQAGVRLYAAKWNGDEPVVDEVNVVEAGAALARVHVRRGTPLWLSPGVFEAQVRVTGCIGDDDCSDILVDVTYTVVHLELEGYPSGMVQDSGLRPAPIHLRRRVDESEPPRLLVPIRRTDESDFAWTAEVNYGIADSGPEWLSVSGSGSSSDPLELTTDVLYDVPRQLSTQVEINGGDAVNLSVTVLYETLLPIEVSTHELTFRAKVGERPEPQTVRIFDAAGESYPWALASGGFVVGCSVREDFKIELVEGSWDALPAEFSVTLPASPEPTSETNRCRGSIEVRHIPTTTIVHHEIDVTYEVSE